MSVMDTMGTAMRLQSLIRRADTFGKSRADILQELEFIVQDLQKEVDRYDRDMEEEYRKTAMA